MFSRLREGGESPLSLSQPYLCLLEQYEIIQLNTYSYSPSSNDQRNPNQRAQATRAAVGSVAVVPPAATPAVVDVPCKKTRQISLCQHRSLVHLYALASASSRAPSSSSSPSPSGLGESLPEAQGRQRQEEPEKSQEPAHLCIVFKDSRARLAERCKLLLPVVSFPPE